MIITCDKCSAKFNLDESLLMKDGSTVRCSICKNIFTAYPPPIQKKDKSIGQDKQQSLSIKFETFSDSMDDIEESSNSPLSDDDSESLNDLDFELDDDLIAEYDNKNTKKKKSELNNNLDFEYDLKDNLEEDLEFEKVDESDKYIPNADSKNEHENPELNLETDLNMEFENESPDDKTATGPDLNIEELKKNDDDEKSGKSLDEESNFSKFNGISEHDETPIQRESPKENILSNATDYIKKSKKETSEGNNIKKPASELTACHQTITGEKNLKEFYPDDIAHDFKLADDFKKPVKKPAKVGKPVLIVLIIAIMILAGYSISIMEGIKVPYISNIKIPFLTQYLASSNHTTAPVRLVPDKESINGRFVTNSSAGTLFVITGRVTNSSQILCSHIKVTGTLITKRKIKAKSKTVFCGNLIAENKLVSLKMTAINTIMLRKAGNNNSNVNIAPGHSIPFMIVFSDLPENLKNFTVNVAGFEREPVKK